MEASGWRVKDRERRRRDTRSHSAALCGYPSGMIQMPERYSPFNHLDRAYKRRATVLESMISAGYLTRPEAETMDYCNNI